MRSRTRRTLDLSMKTTSLSSKPMYVALSLCNPNFLVLRAHRSGDFGFYVALFDDIVVAVCGSVSVSRLLSILDVLLELLECGDVLELKILS